MAVGGGTLSNKDQACLDKELRGWIWDFPLAQRVAQKCFTTGKGQAGFCVQFLLRATGALFLPEQDLFALFSLILAACYPLESLLSVYKHLS